MRKIGRNACPVLIQLGIKKLFYQNASSVPKVDWSGDPHRPDDQNYAYS
ncbi:hypothetical protein JOD43_004452 [Pullulanibacillus pueri]|nr:hypothetical protein [Pullulanibacillus pueri]